MSAACVVVVEVGGEEKGDELKNLSWRKGRWREKVNRRQLCQLGEHENLGRGGFEQSNVWSVGSDSLPAQIKHSLACCGCTLPFGVETQR